MPDEAGDFLDGDSLVAHQADEGGAQLARWQEQAGIAERRQPRPRETAVTRRARERAAQALENPPEATLLPWRAGLLAKAIHVLQIREA